MKITDLTEGTPVQMGAKAAGMPMPNEPQALARTPKRVWQGYQSACAAAVIKMIFNYYRVSAPSMQRIYETLRTYDSEDAGILTSDAARYLEKYVQGEALWYVRHCDFDVLYDAVTNKDTPVYVSVTLEGISHAMLAYKATRSGYVYCLDPAPRTGGRATIHADDITGMVLIYNPHPNRFGGVIAKTLMVIAGMVASALAAMAMLAESLIPGDEDDHHEDDSERRGDHGDRDQQSDISQDSH